MTPPVTQSLPTPPPGAPGNASPRSAALLVTVIGSVAVAVIAVVVAVVAVTRSGGQQPAAGPAPAAVTAPTSTQKTVEAVPARPSASTPPSEAEPSEAEPSAAAPPATTTAARPTTPAPRQTTPAPQPTTPSSQPTTPAPRLGSPIAPVPLGQAAVVGDYEVTVTGVDFDADAVVAGANQFNDPPTGRYIIVEVTAQYVGTEEGQPGWDLSYVYNGTDARQYSDSECGAVIPNGGLDAPTLNPGGSASFQMCMDVPPAAIDGGQLFIEPLLAFDRDGRVFFAVR